MTRLRERPGTLRLLVLAVTVVFVALALVVGRAPEGETPLVTVGLPSPQRFVANETVPIEDAAATDRERTRARNAVETVVASDPQADIAVGAAVALVFERARAATEPLVPDEPDDSVVPTTSPPEETTTTETTPVEGDETTTTTTEPEPTTTTTTVVELAPLDIQRERLNADYAIVLRDSTIETLLALLEEDYASALDGGERYFANVEQAALGLAKDRLDAGILPGDLPDEQVDIRRNPPFVSLPGLSDERRADARLAIADIVATFLQANRRIDLIATDQAKEEAAAAVEPVIVTFIKDQTVVDQGQIITEVQLDAIERLGLLEPVGGANLAGTTMVGALVVLLAAFFLWRVAPAQWAEPKHFALLGVLLLLAAIVARIPEAIAGENPALGYLIPTMMFGYLAAILFDPRTALLMSVPVGVFTALATGDTGLTIYAAGASLTAVPFVSSASSRRQLRLAVLSGALLAAPFAGAIAWVFLGSEAVRDAFLFGAAGGVIGGLVAQGLLSFLETLFGITTTSTLLDLTDRNHPALRLLEEQAPGTFNHSIMVGTLAGKAARAIGANPLLAQAAAYYHDLGKVENPQFFIENQFGVSNPHDDLDPAESARLIRAHVSDGLRLARRYAIPPDVANGILMHHGDGLMRYFYHKALAQDPDVDPGMFRHHGERPREREMAIIMLSDAVEGAARAMVQHEDPTSDSLRKLVDQIVAEKVEDGQLDHSQLTFGDLTRIKEALVDALVAYYHTRITYPGFPGGQR